MRYGYCIFLEALMKGIRGYIITGKVYFDRIKQDQVKLSSVDKFHKLAKILRWKCFSALKIEHHESQ